jgi:Uma2 family endonuclease
MAKQPAPTEKRVVLSGVTWQKFEGLLSELGQNRTARMTYDRGKLEMMTPLEEHDRCARLLESLILVFAEEVRLPVQSLGSVLLMRPDIGHAIQPESCYVVGDDGGKRGLPEWNLNQHQPPDLVVDVAIAKGSFDRYALYESMEVPEVWRYLTKAGDDVLKGNLTIHHLEGGIYVERPTSLLFPFLPARRILEFLEQSDSLGLAQALAVLRDWIQKNL